MHFGRIDLAVSSISSDLAGRQLATLLASLEATRAAIDANAAITHAVDVFKEARVYTAAHPRALCLIRRETDPVHERCRD